MEMSQTFEADPKKFKIRASLAYVILPCFAALLSILSSFYIASFEVTGQRMESKADFVFSITCSVFLIAMALVWANFAYQFMRDRTLVNADEDSVTFCRVAFRRHSATLGRDFITNFEVDTLGGDNDGGRFEIRISNSVPESIQQSPVWSKVDDTALYYDYGGGEIDPHDLSALLKDWLET